jgi:hypothetical protein
MVVVVQGHAELLEVVAALHACRCLANLLHGREKERNESPDDRDDDQEFDETEGRPKQEGGGFE